MRQASVKQTLQSFWPLVVTGAATGLLTIVSSRWIRYENMVDDVGIWGGFFTVFGVIYAIIAGFLLVEVLGRFGALNNAIEAELNAIECLRDYLIYLDDDQIEARAKIYSTLIGYVKSVREDEWHEMGAATDMIDSDTSEELYAIMRSIKSVVTRTDTDSVVLASLMDKLSEVTVQRTLRISLVNQRLPVRLRFLLIFMSIVLSIGFLLVPVANIWVHLLMTTTLAISVHLLSLIIEDLDHPFFGVWNIDTSAMDQLIVRLTERHAQINKA